MKKNAGSKEHPPKREQREQREQRERSEEEHAAQMQALLRLLQLPVTTEAELVTAALDSLVALTQSRLGFIGLIDPAEATMSAYVWSDQGSVQRDTDESPLQFHFARGELWSTAVEQHRAVTENDCDAAHPGAVGYPVSGVPLVRFLAVPLIRDGRAVLLAGQANKSEDYCEEDRIGTTIFLEGLWGRLAHQRATAALQASEERHRTLFESSSDAIMTLAPPSWRFAAGNPATLRIYGAADEADFVSRAPWEYSPEKQPDGRPSAEKALEMIQTAMTSGSCFFEWTHKRVDTGEAFPATVLLSRMTIGGRALLQATVRDISHVKQLEAQLAQSDRLSSMGMLAAGVAHEINNPLSYILYNIESLADDLPRLSNLMRRCLAELTALIGSDGVARVLGDGQKTFRPATFDDIVDRLREALSGTRRIRDISRSLGLFSRVENTALIPVEVQTVMEHVVTMAFNEIKYRARLVNDFYQVPAVLASEGKLAQVFLNLVINAAQSIDEGHVERNVIRLSTWTEDSYVVAEISDTGKGIAPEHYGRIFDPFFTTKGAGLGSGLGLSICKNIVTSFGGEIRFVSQVGKGTSFQVKLPQTPDGWEWRTKEEADEPAVVGAEERGRILVVDDEEGVRSAILRLIGREHEVLAASSGQQARALLEQDGCFDVIFCDLMMPEMSGMELHAWLAARNPGLAEQMVFITGGAFTPGSVAYLAKVRNLRLEKPFDAAAFKKLTNELVFTARRKHPA